MQLEAVLKSKMCSGCGLCASILGPGRARMELQEEGYLRPVLTGEPTETERALIAEVCPGSRVHLPEGGDGLAAPELGPLVSVATGYATNADLRHHASSGGVISAIAEHLLASGRAEFVLQVTASGEVPWLNQVITSTGPDDVRRASGSRYAPSAPLAELGRFLDRGVPFAVIGKPCDIAALRAYARHDARVGRLVVAMIAFMCGGIPSERGIRQLLRRIGAEPDDVVGFRYRGNGWPGQATALMRTGAEHSISYAESWGAVLSRHVQLRCKICADGIGMSADVVCADAWYGDERGYPLFDEAEGRSLVLARTATGEALIEAARQAGHLATDVLDGREIERMQPYQVRRTRLTLSRLAALRLVGHGATRFTGRSLWLFARHAGLRANLRSFLGTIARAVRGRL